MENYREKLIPSSDLAEFYARKISTSLSLIYGYWDDVDNNKLLLLKLNKELHEIYKQIKSRLERFDKKETIKKYEELNKNISRLKPLIRVASKDKETGDRIVKVKPTKHYQIYKRYVDQKECIMWECLDELGLLGKVEVQGRRLR